MISQFDISIYELPLKLRSAWGTSHSTTTERRNLACKVSLKTEKGVFVGFGEAGLPPFKPGCYYGTVESCLEFAALLKTRVLEGALEMAKTNFFSGNAGKELKQEASNLLATMDRTGDFSVMEHRPCRCMIEMAIFDAVGVACGETLYELLSLEEPKKGGFITVSLKENIDEMVEELCNFSKMTNHIKIKLNNDFTKCVDVLSALDRKCKELEAGGAKFCLWAIDANAGWDAEFCMAILDILQKYQARIFMIEQPHPLGFPKSCEDELSKWADVKTAFNNTDMPIVADEVFNGADDVSLLAPYVDGVNCKLEKCGGLRFGVEALRAAKEAGMLTWVGMMVASSLSATAHAHLLSLTARGGDVDGSLLCTPESDPFTTSVVISKGNVAVPNTPGIGCVPKPQEFKCPIMSFSFQAYF